MLSDARIETLREDLLQVFHASDKAFGTGATEAMNRLRRYGFHPPEVTEDDVIAQIEILQVKAFLAPLENQLAKGARLWRITPAGRKWLDEHGF